MTTLPTTADVVTCGDCGSTLKLSRAQRNAIALSVIAEAKDVARHDPRNWREGQRVRVRGTVRRARHSRDFYDRTEKLDGSYATLELDHHSNVSISAPDKALLGLVRRRVEVRAWVYYSGGWPGLRVIDIKPLDTAA